MKNYAKYVLALALIFILCKLDAAAPSTPGKNSAHTERARRRELKRLLPPDPSLAGFMTIEELALQLENKMANPEFIYKTDGRSLRVLDGEDALKKIKILFLADCATTDIKNILRIDRLSEHDHAELIIAAITAQHDNPEENLRNLSMLVSIGINMNARSQSGGTALHYAASQNRALCMKWLLVRLGSGAMNIQDSAGNVPLHYACQYGHLKIITILLKLSNIIINVRNEADKTPLQEARAGGHNYLVYCLRMKHLYKLGIAHRKKILAQIRRAYAIGKLLILPTAVAHIISLYE